jgi:peptide/nickel transport system substrate-binding protein
MAEAIRDTFNRPLRDLRISVTDRCNFRCAYCMPAEIFGEHYRFLPKAEILTFEEITRLTGIIVRLGAVKLRITGGEPLVREELETLIAMLRPIDGVDDLTLTTNGFLLPKSMTATPEAFNKGFLDGPGPSAGPFIISSIDRTAQRITLTRNPKWWGTVPRLDTITYTVLDDSARIPALQNNAIDAAAVGSLDELTIVRRTPGLTLRRAPSANWYHFTFNGAPGSILADPALRIAIAKGIDRQTIANVSQRGLVDTPVPLNNHIYVAGQKGYQDNSGVAAFDPEAAKKELDDLGWRMNGQFREKDGKQLVIRDVFYDAQSTRQVGQIAQNSLAQIGVKLDLQAKGGNGFFSQYITVGNFDIAQWAWGGDAFPLSGLTQIYLSTGESNNGRIGSPAIDAKIEQTLEELDPDKTRALANELDKMIWAEGFSLPLFQAPGNVAVRNNLANFGAAGLGDVDYTAIGFMKS